MQELAPDLALSPCELLNARDKFRQAPPQSLLQTKYGEVEGIFASLITLCHIRKLLSSHGIKPAYEMLEEKLKQGDIMHSLSSIEGSIKATEFIGQSSGKSSKGQTQKVQQAVLQKFRAGGYNVIVATSIGEEGLDIMEVDLVPHACKPEVEFVKLSIGQFVHRGRKVKDDQCLRGLSNLKSYKAFHVEGRTSSSKSLEVISAAEDNNCPKDSDCFQDAPKSLFRGELPFFKESPRVTAGGKDKDWESDFYSRMPPVHRFLFESEFISLNSGNVTIAFVPTLPLTKDPDFKGETTVKNAMPSINMNTNTDPFISVEIKHCEKLSVQAESSLELVDSSELRCMKNACVSASPLPILDVHQGKTLSQTNEVILHTSVPKTFVLISENSADDEVLADSDKEHRPSLACGAEDNFSPRLTSFIEEGVVPESPIVNISSLSPKVEHFVCLSPTSEHDEYGLHVKCAANVQGNDNSNDLGKSGKLSDIHGNIQSLALANVSGCNPTLDIDPSLTKSNLLEIEKAGIQGPGCLMDFIKGIDLSSPSNVEVRTPLANQTNKNSGEDWPPNPCEMSNSIKQERKYRRLCKLRDINKKKPYKALEEEFISNGGNTCEPIIRIVSGPSSGPGKKKVKSNVKVFIEEEVEVSASAEASEDEEDGNDDDAYDDSFIDDHTNPSVGSTQAEVGGHDMMAVYRRSLLSQSPAITLPHRTLSPKTAESGGSSTEMINNSLQTPRTNLQSEHLSTDRNSISCKLVTAETGNLLKENDQKLEIRKRKLNFQPVGSFYSMKIQREHKLQSEADITTSETHQLEQVEPSIDAVFDDMFYEHLDLDEVEAQATKLLKSKLFMEKNPRTIPNHTNQIKNDMSLNLPGSPSFDLDSAIPVGELDLQYILYS
ncbi:hypothetical protein QJS10_CPB13g00720 [Acorus calamus]|uniref:Helicase C-terminal domain-containing protein n=1 Tax=Acorus calamus TaxID=4465 RepID=A0AAV9DHP4_ACOCL|nr:hypothetical protein QJS10_CPB13g00720 [Acorus calamus]